MCAEGLALSERFDLNQPDDAFHPFVAADYDEVFRALIPHRGPALRFLEWGSATGVITIMADLLGFDAFGIELDAGLVATARRLATRFGSGARFVVGSFLPEGYSWEPVGGDGRTGTLGTGSSGYLQFGHALDEFDVVFGYPWDGEESLMLDLMKRYGRADALLLLHGVNDGVKFYRSGRNITGGGGPTLPHKPGE